AFKRKASFSETFRKLGRSLLQSLSLRRRGHETALDNRSGWGFGGGFGWMEGPGGRSSVAAGAACSRADGAQGVVQSRDQRCLRAADIQTNRGARTGACGAGIQEYPIPEEDSGRAIPSDHERGIQQRAGRELQTLSCGGRFLER